MAVTRGVNHLALSVASMKRTLAFYTELLDMRLLGLFPMHGVPGASHAFLDMGGGQLLSFIEFAPVRAGALGVSHPQHPGAPSAAPSMHHVALAVADEAALRALRARLVTAGVRTSEPYDHGFCTSIYFHGPDGEQLEATWQSRPLDERELDAETFRALGIEASERTAMTRARA